MADQFKTEITAEHAQFDSAMEAAAETSLTTAQALQSSFREAGLAMGNSMREGMAAMSEAFNEGLGDAKRHFTAFSEWTQTQSKILGIAIGVLLAGTLVGAIYTAYRVISAAAGFIKGLFTGESYKSSNIDALVATNKEVKELQGALQLTAQQAQAVGAAIEAMGGSKSDYIDVFKGAAAAVRTNADELDRLGIAYKDAKGDLLPLDQVVQNVNTKLNSYTEGWDRNQAATAVGIGTAAQVAAAASITAQKIAEAKERLDAYNLGIGEESQAAVARYEAAMLAFNRETELTSQGFKRAIADNIMPLLTDLAEFFRDGFPAAVNIFRYSMASITFVFYQFKTGIYTVAEAVLGAIESITFGLTGLNAAFAKALRGDFEGAKNALVQGWNDAKDRLAQVGDNIRAQIDHNQAAVRQAFAMDGRRDQPGRSPTGEKWKPKPDAETEGGGGGPGRSRVSQWEADLAALRDGYDRQKEEQGSFERWSKDHDAAYWSTMLDTTGISGTERAAVEKKYFDLRAQIRKDAFDGETADIHRSIDAQRQGSEARVRMSLDEAVRQAQAHGMGSQQTAKALQDVQKYQRDVDQQTRQLQELEVESAKNAQIERIEIEKQRLDTEESLGTISAEEKLRKLRDLKQQEFDIERQAAQLLAFMRSEDVVAYQQALEAMAQARRKNSLDLGQIDAKIQSEGLKPWRDLFGAITNGFGAAVKGVIMGTQTLAQATRNILQSVALAVIDLGVKMLAEKALQAITSRLIEKTTAASQIAANAAVAASAAFASTAAIPIIGPELAPAAAAASYAGAMSWMGALASAARGFDIPAGMSPMTQLHPEEMVLPDHIANPLRENLAAGGGVTRSGAIVNLTIKALDGRDVYRVLTSSDALARALRSVHRNGALS